MAMPSTLGKLMKLLRGLIYQVESEAHAQTLEVRRATNVTKHPAPMARAHLRVEFPGGNILASDNARHILDDLWYAP